MKIFLFKNGKPAGSPGSGHPHTVPSSSPAVSPATASKTARKVQSAGPANDLSKPVKKDKLPEIVKKMPEGKIKEFAKAFVDIGKQYGVSENAPIVKLALMLCAFMGKYAHLVDRIPGNYRKGLDEGKYLKERFNYEQVQGLRKQMSEGFSGDDKGFSAVFDSYNSKTKLDASMVSTLFVSYMLFGSPKNVEYPTDHKILAAKLAHENILYKDSTLITLKKQKTIPKGTVIFFSKNLKSGVIAACATGNRQGFKYCVPKSKEIKTFQLDGADSPIKSGLNLLAAFSPTKLVATKSSELAQEELALPRLESEVRSQMQNPHINEKYEKIAEILFPVLTRLSAKMNQDPRYKEFAKRYVEIINDVLAELEKDIRKAENSKKPVNSKLSALIVKFKEHIQIVINS